MTPTDAPAPETAIERLTKFAVEWSVLMAAGHYSDLVYGLHGGDVREAELRHSDICALLEFVETRASQEQPS